MTAKLIVRCLVLAALAACTMEDASGAAGSGGTGVGGSGPCANEQIEVPQLISTEIECDLSAAATQCADECEVECALHEFDLGVRGSACAMEADGNAYCRCICAYCRAR